MRRSKSITLTLLCATALPGCDPAPQQDVVVQDVAACIAKYGAGSETECHGAFTTGTVEHERTAPRFETIEACQAATGGRCGEARPAWMETLAAENGTPSPGGNIIPLMAGLLIGRATSGGTMATPVYEGRPPPRECPPDQSCRGSSGGGSTAFFVNGQHWGTATGPGNTYGTPIARSAVAAEAASGAGVRGGAGAVARGGFGGSAAAFSGGAS